MKYLRITDFFRKVFKKGETSVNIRDYKDDLTNISIQSFALFTTVELIASMMANIEYKVYKNSEEYESDLWYKLNIKPNETQTSSEFWHELWCKLLYNQEVLIVQLANHNFIIADDFNAEEKNIDEIVFTQVSRGGFTLNKAFTTSDVLYLRYTNSNINSFINGIFTMYDEMISEAKDEFSKNSGEKGILEIQAIAQGKNDFEERFTDLMNNRFKSYFNNKNAVLPLFDGYSYKPTQTLNARTISEVTDITNLVNEALARAAQIYKIPPALVRGEVAGLKEAFDIMLTTCIDPLASMASEGLTSQLYKKNEVIKGNYIAADTSCVKHFDVFDMSANIDKLIACGFFSPNEARKKRGIQRINEEWADSHYITKNYENAHGLRGGEDDEQDVGNKNVENSENS